MEHKGGDLKIIEPQHDKTNKMSVCPAKTQADAKRRLTSAQSDQSLRCVWGAKDPSFLHADSEDFDQTGQFCCVAAHIMLWLLISIASASFCISIPIFFTGA